MRKEPYIEQPSKEQVQHYLRTWDEQENNALQEKALNKLFFETYPTNTDIRDILIKASSLNDFYSTNIINIFAVAKHIQALDIDKRLEEGDASLVHDIADMTIGGKKRRLYSFASKYCSHHKPMLFPIYDSYVDRVLRHFRKQDRFCSFKDEDLKNYPKFINVLNAFQEFYGLDGVNKKNLDKYLWQLGKNTFHGNNEK